MARTRKLSQDDIVNSAFELIAEIGLNNLSARSVAKQMGCSTQPIYQEFKSMADLRQHIFLKIDDYLQTEIFTKAITGDNVVDMGLSYIHFATHESELFKILFLDDYGGGERMHTFSYEMFTKRAQEDATYAQLTGEQMNRLHNGTWITVTGLASLSCSAIIHPTTEQLVAIIKDSIRVNM